MVQTQYSFLKQNAKGSGNRLRAYMAKGEREKAMAKGIKGINMKRRKKKGNGKRQNPIYVKGKRQKV